MGGKAHLVGHDDHGHALVRQSLHDVQHLAHQFGIKRGCRLVEQHQLGLHRDGAGNRHALLLTTRQARGMVGDLVAQTHFGQGIGGALHRLGLGDAAHADQALGHVFLRRHMWPEVELLEDHPDRTAHLAQLFRRHLAPAGAVVADEIAVDADLARIIFLEEIDTAQQRGFSRTRRPDQAGHLAGRDRERDVFQRVEGAVVFVDRADLDGGCLDHLTAFRSGNG